MTGARHRVAGHVSLEIVVEAQREFLAVDSPEALALALWTLARRLADVTSLRLYRRSGSGSELVVAVPPEAAAEDPPAALHRARASSATWAPRAGTLIAWTPARPATGAVVLEHGGGDDAGLEAAAVIAAGALGQLLERAWSCEQERRHFAQRLHDGVAQDLAYVNLRIELLERALTAQPDDLPRLVTELRADVAAAAEGLRSAIGDLREGESGWAGVERAGPHRSELERVVLGIVRESLTNIRKHAGATHVQIDLEESEGGLTLVVRDNGAGIQQLPAARASGHFGIAQMRELAAELGGSLAIEGENGGGTRVVAQIPVGSVEWVW